MNDASDRPDTDGGSPPPRPDDGPTQGWHPVARVILYLALFIGLMMFAGLPAFLVWFVASGASSEDMAALAAGPTAEVPVALALLQFAFAALAVVPMTFVLVRFLDRRSLAAVRLVWPGATTALRRSVVAAGATLALLGAWLLATTGFGAAFAAADLFIEPVRWAVEGLDATMAVPARGAGILALVLVGFLIQGSVEELVFRGYVLATLEERWSWATAAAVSSVLFTGLHSLNPNVSPAGLVNTFLLGLLLAVVTVATDGLVVACVAHGVWNFTVGSILSLPISGLSRLPRLLEGELVGPEVLTGGGYGPEGSWALTAILVPLVLVGAMVVDRRRGEDGGDGGDGENGDGGV